MFCRISVLIVGNIDEAHCEELFVPRVISMTVQTNITVTDGKSFHCPVLQSDEINSPCLRGTDVDARHHTACDSVGVVLVQELVAAHEVWKIVLFGLTAEHALIDSRSR